MSRFHIKPHTLQTFMKARKTNMRTMSAPAAKALRNKGEARTKNPSKPKRTQESQPTEATHMALRGGKSMLGCKNQHVNKTRSLSSTTETSVTFLKTGADKYQQ